MELRLAQKLSLMKEDPFVLSPREIGPTLYDTVAEACRKAGFEPVIGQREPGRDKRTHLVEAAERCGCPKTQDLRIGHIG
jgi:hypothetical protein